LRTAIAHDWLNQYGGAEVVLEAMHDLYPDAPIYTSLYAAATMPAAYRAWDIRTSFLQRLPGVHRYFRALLPLYPIGFEQFDLTGYDLIISSSSAWAKGVVPGPNTLHICYCHAPMRYVWDVYYEAARRFRAPLRAPLMLVIHYLRMWDVLCARRVDHFVANSRYVAGKIWKYYRRDATVIHPPVDTEYFTPMDEDGEFYLVVARLRPYKRIDLAVGACNRLHLPLKVIGTGSERRRLEAMAGPTVEILGFQPADQLRRDFARCKALIQTNKEDFGIASLEAQSAGRPVVAYGAGGALETVLGGETGVLFQDQTVESLVGALERMERLSFDKAAIRKHALRFSRARFLREFSSFVTSRYLEAQTERQGRMEACRGERPPGLELVSADPSACAPELRGDRSSAHCSSGNRACSDPGSHGAFTGERSE